MARIGSLEERPDNESVVTNVARMSLICKRRGQNTGVVTGVAQVG